MGERLSSEQVDSVFGWGHKSKYRMALGAYWYR